MFSGIYLITNEEVTVMDTNELGFIINMNLLHSHVDDLERQLKNARDTINYLNTLSTEERIRYLDIDICCFPDIPLRTKHSLMRFVKLHHSDGMTASQLYIMGRNKIRKLSEIDEKDIKDLDNFFINHGYTWHD